MNAYVTARELELIEHPGKLVELVRGHLVVGEPPGTRHGAISANLGTELAIYARQHNAGLVFAQDTGFKIAADPDTVRAPDVAFVSTGRTGAIPARGYAELTPDLIAEVVSPADQPAAVLAKVADWLAARARLVWVIDPGRREARVYRPDGSLSVLGSGDALDGESILPGFSCLLSRILI